MHDAQGMVFSLSQTLAGVGALGWCVVLFLSLAGWGKAIAVALKLERPGTALSVALGLALECLLGGVLNLADLVSDPVLFGFTGIGVVLWLALAWRDWDGWARLKLWGEGSAAGRGLLVLVFVALGVHLFSFIQPAHYNQWDDLQAYLVLPWKMLQVHHLAADPYSQRRVINSVGFVYFLQDTFLAAEPLKNITLVDGGLGILLLMAAALGIARELKLSRTQMVWFFLLAGLTKQLAWNLSFNWLPCGLYLVMVLVALREDLERRPVLQALLIGGLVGVDSSLKNNHVVCSVMFVLCLYAMMALVRRQALVLVRGVGLAGMMALVVLLPWMLDLKHYSGTYFFPILGHGYEYTTYHLLPSRNVNSKLTVLKCFAAGLPILLLAALQLFWVKWSRAGTALIAFTLASGLSIVAVGLATGGDSIRRYTYPQSMAALLLLLPVVAVLCRQRPGWKWRRGLETAAVVLVLVAYVSDAWQVKNGFNSLKAIAGNYTGDLVASWYNPPLNPPQVTAEYRAAQAAIPAGTVVLENATYAYLFDYRRNTIYEASLPAMASPPPAPGWPILGDGEALGQWLTGHGVRYLIYSYGDEAMEETEKLPQRIADAKQFQVVRSTQMANLRANHQYLQLAGSRKKVFDDGMVFVLDLSASAPTSSAPSGMR